VRDAGRDRLRVGQAVRLSRRGTAGREVAANFTGPDHRSQVRELRAPQTNAIRAKAIVLYNLHLHSQAYVQCLRAEETASVKDSPEIWLPHIVRDKLKALAHRSRFSIREAEECARLGWDACASQAWDANVAEMLSLLIDLSLVGCYLSYGGHSCLARASSMMEQHLDRVRANRAGAITPLHKVMFYKTLAELECAAGPRGARDAGVDFGRALSTALTIASRAGLANQLRKIRLRYGTTALRLAEQEGIELS